MAQTVEACLQVLYINTLPPNDDIPASGLVCPLGRRIGVPETTTDDALPW